MPILIMRTWMRFKFLLRSFKYSITTLPAIKLLFSFLLIMCFQNLNIPYKISHDGSLLDVLYTVVIYINIGILFLVMIQFLYLFTLLSYREDVPDLSKTYAPLVIFLMLNNLVFYFTEANKLTFTISLYFTCLGTFFYLLKPLKINVFTLYEKIEQFKEIKNTTQFIPLCYSPNFKLTSQVDHFYVVSFNRNIKTWLHIGIIIISKQNGVFIKRKLISYNDIDFFNDQFEKKIAYYTKDELNLLNMYSI